MKSLTAACIALLALALASPLMADEAEEYAALFTRLDQNQDGKVSADEAGTKNATLFNRLLRRGDTDRDKLLTRDEFVAGLSKPETVTRPGGFGGRFGRRGRSGGPPTDIFRRMDANGDGKLTLDEFPAPRREQLKRFIERFDKNGDQAVSREEFTPVGRPARRQPTRRPDASSSSNTETSPGLDRLLQADTNQDGKLSKSEAPARVAPFFERADRNNDGYLDLAELQAIAARLRDR